MLDQTYEKIQEVDFSSIQVDCSTANGPDPGLSPQFAVETLSSVGSDAVHNVGHS